MLVLYVDDDIDDLELFRDAVKAANPQVSCMLFESGRKLLDFLAVTGILPDYIFIDINMPKMNGYECAREIRAHKAFDRIHIVMYSTAFSPNDLFEFAKLKFKWLTKPSKVRELIQSIKGLLE